MTGMMVSYEKKPKAITLNHLSLADCMEIYRLFRKGASPGHIGKMYGISGKRVEAITRTEAREAKQ